MDYQTAPYRRGLTLGLTMAEIFMLLLFLFLMLLAALNIARDNADDELADELHGISRTVREIRGTLINDETELVPAQSGTKSPRHQLPKTITHLKRDTDALHEYAQEEKDEDSLEGLRQDLKEENRELATENRDLQQDLEALQEEVLSASDLRKENRTLQQEIGKLRGDIFINNKGINPPCWYEVTTRDDKRHEKTHFLLDIAVHDEFLRVRPSCQMPPPGRAEDELGPQRSATTSYKEEYEQLPFAPFSTEREFTLAEFTENATPIKEMGRNSQVRNYECVFQAWVWDRTAETAKGRWKQAIDEIEKSIYTTEVKNDPWEPQKCRQ